MAILKVQELVDGGIPPFTLREKDILELRAAGLDPMTAVEKCAAASDASWAVWADEAPLCTWGVRERADGDADIWLLTTAEVERHPIAFVRESRRLMAILLETFPILHVDVWADYSQALDWLDRLGFVISHSSSNHFIHLTRTSNGRA